MSSFILESAIFQESQVVKKTPTKAIFRNVIQTCDEINRNKRIYPRNVLDEGMSNCKSRMARRAFYGELDHPFITGNQTFDGIRQTTVSLKEVSHIITNYDWDGNRLVAEMETCNTPNGKILYGLLTDKSGIGFSMRGMAELERVDNYNKVKSPLTIIANDAVSRPSHQAAVVNFNEMRFESHQLLETIMGCKSHIQESDQSGVICFEGKCYLAEYFDKLIEKKYIQFFDTWI
jgi:hypothetical protein